MHYAKKKVKNCLFVAVISDERSLTDTELKEVFSLFGPGYFTVSEGVWGNCDPACIEAFQKKGWEEGGRAEIVLDYMKEMGTLQSQRRAAKEMGLL